MTQTPSDTLLRRTLLGNALFTFLCGLALVAASGTLATVIGAVRSVDLIIVGGILLVYALDLGRTARAHPIPRGRILYFIVMDVIWVLGSALVLWGFALPFTTAGRWLILLVADAVGLFAVLQYIGLRRAESGTGAVRSASEGV